MSKKYSILIIAAIVIAALLGLWSLSKKKAVSPKPSDTQVNQEMSGQAKAPEIKKVEVGTLPDKFPADFPIESGAKILNNYNVDNGDSIQASRQFATKKTLASNYTFYTDYLKTNGWTILGQSNETTLKSIAAIKGNVNLMINMNQNSITKENAVDITFTIPK